MSTVPVLFKANSTGTFNGFDLKNIDGSMLGWNPHWKKEAGAEGISPLNTVSAYSTLHAWIANAVREYTKRGDAAFTLVRTRQNTYAVEARLGSGRYLLANASRNGEFRAALVTASNMRCEPLEPWSTEYLIDQVGNEGLSALFAPLTMNALDIIGPAETDIINRLRDSAAIDWTRPVPEVYRICDDVYYAVRCSEYSPKMPGGSVGTLTKGPIQNGTMYGDILCGPVPDLLFGANGQRCAADRAAPVTVREAKQRFRDWRAKHVRSGQERVLIPVFPDDYPVPPEAMKIATRYVETSGKETPMRNFLWRGITGCGKTTGVDLIACVLDMPRLRTNCHSTMDANDFLSAMVPCSAPEPCAELPTFMEIECAPESAYFRLTGEDREDVDQQMVLDAYAKACEARGNGGGAMFRHVEADYVKALKNGWIIELSEVSLIRDSGVLPGLNNYDRPGAVIPLMDGSYARRHPDAMVIMTDNVGYQGRRPIDQSVLRRQAFIIDTYEMPKENVLERVRYNTKCSDETLLDKMYEVWNAIRSYCREQEITEGEISICELENWVMAVQADGMRDIAVDCVECVIAKASSDPVEQKDIKAATLDILAL